MLSQTLVALSCAASAIAASAPKQFDWGKIEPTEDLRYHPCYEGLKCARLKVPLDWHDSASNRSAAIAIAALPATVPEDDPSFGGTIILNPGGPGGSGVGFVRSLGRRIRGIVDGNKHYEMLSFDPRGIMYTTPRAECFNDIFARDTIGLEMRGIGSLDSSSDALRRFHALTKGYGAVCAETNRDEEILEHVSTAVVARDMVEIVDRIEELREKTLKKASYASRRDSNQLPLVGEEIGEKEKKAARIQYMGFSYGTILGNTFMSMFPGRVGRMIIDGVDDAVDYSQGLWLCNLHDTEETIKYFYDGCFQAGTECPIYKKSDQSSADIKSRIDALIAELDASPVPFVNGKEIAVVTGNDLRISFVLVAYQPITYAREQAQVLAQALEGNFTAVLNNLYIPKIQDACQVDPKLETTPDAQSAILCSDGGDATGHDVNYYRNQTETLKGQSETFGAYWSTITMQCAGWKSRAKWRFTGPYTSPPADPSLKEGVPAAPMLLLSTKFDPVTPLRNAWLMSAGHPGSAVVVQDSVGHCASVSAWSDCTNEIVRDYLENGTVPKNGTVCQSKCKPWKERECNMPKELSMAGAEMETLTAPRGWPIRQPIW